MPNWTSRTLAEVVTLQRGHDLPATQRGDGPVPVIGSFGITGFHDVARYRGPGVAIGRSGASIGTATYCTSDYWPLNTCLFVKDFLGNDPRWVFYLLDSIDFSGYNSGSAQPSLNRNFLAKIPVSLPPIEEQQGIAATLGTLDDKIESNRRASEILRQLGKAEVNARIGGRRSTLNDIALSISRGITPKYADGDPATPLVLNQRCIRDKWISIDAARHMHDRNVADTKRVSSGDILVNSTGTGTLGRVGRWHHGGIFADSHISIVKPDASKIGPTVLAYLLFDREGDIEEMATGSTGQTELSPSRLGQLELALPSAEDAAELEQILAAFEDRAASLQAENNHLVSLRDTLLPGLLSGRIRVPEASGVVS
jgi:type I restriction enzyme, S subunit